MSADKFKIRLPFLLPPDMMVVGGAVLVLGREGKVEQASSGPDGHQELLYIGDFDGETAAHSALARIRTGFVWAGLEYGFGVDFETHTAPHIVRPSSALILDVGFPTPTILLSLDAERFGSSVAQGAALPGAEAVWDQPKLSLALNVFAHSYFETAAYERFLTRVNVLEILKRDEPRPDVVLDAIERWKIEVDQLEGSGQVAKAEADSLRGSLGHLRTQSIGRSIRSVVTSALGDARGKRARYLYDERSTLVHNGTTGANIHDLDFELERLCRDLLKAMISSDGPPIASS